MSVRHEGRGPAAGSAGVAGVIAGRRTAWAVALIMLALGGFVAGMSKRVEGLGSREAVGSRQ